MKSKKLAAGFCSLLLMASFFFPVSASAESGSTAGEVQSLIDGIAVFEEKQSGADSVQAWLNGSLASGAGTSSEWYAMALRQSGLSLDFSAYASALSANVQSSRPHGATERQRCALALIACGRANDPFVSSAMEDSVGELGIMSWIFGLHLMNNGAASSSVTAPEAVAQILSLRHADGGWSLSGSYADADVTAMAVQALAPYAPYRAEVRSAVDGAVSLLASKQLASGGFSSYGTENAESAAQVVLALASAGVNPLTDSRFQKNGVTLLEVLKRYRLSDGSFSHTAGGASNASATMQVFCALVALKRFQNGLGPFYLFGSFSPASFPAESTQASDSPASSAAEESASGGAQASGETSEAAPQQPDSSAESISSVGSEEPAMTSSGDSAESAADASGTSAGSPAESAAALFPSEASSAAAQASGGAPGYKLWACLAAAVLGLAACLVLWLRGKRNRKSYLFVLILTAAAAGLVCATNIQTRSQYYSGTAAASGTAGKVTMTIRCDTVAGKSDSSHIPASGVILPATEFPIDGGNTVYTVLTAAARQYGIQMESRGSAKTAYIAGIQYLYEFDFGDLSGWIYRVNGETPSVGCGECELKDGDRVEWLYSCSLGDDLK
jgi:hypothetical protein